jgi:hypothetical protein
MRLVLGLLLLAVLSGCVQASVQRGADGSANNRATIPFADARMIVEVNATDGDAGLQVFLDGEPWKAVTIHRPDGRRMLDVTTRAQLRDYGLTELFSESSEPSFEEFPLEQFKALWPEGRYRFTGQTIEGDRLTGSAVLRHDIPDGPEIVDPADEATIGARDAVVRWRAGAQPAGVEIVGYQVVVTREDVDPPDVFQVDLPATGSGEEVRIPQQFLAPGVEYKAEVLAIAASGNQTLTEHVFTVE